jgi:hypothetical protein
MRFIISCFLIALLISCEKGTGNFTIKGTITDATNQSGLQGAEIKIYKVPIASTQEILIGTAIIGSDGSYSFTFPREKMERYTLHVKKENYFDLTKDVYYSSLSLNNDNIRNYSTKAKAWIALHFINSNPQATDHLQYIKQSGLQGCTACCPNTEQNYYGALDTTIYCINNGNEIYSVYYWVLNTNNQGLLSTETTSFDTTEIILNY